MELPKTFSYLYLRRTTCTFVSKLMKHKSSLQNSNVQD